MWVNNNNVSIIQSFQFIISMEFNQNHKMFIQYNKINWDLLHQSEFISKYLQKPWKRV